MVVYLLYSNWMHNGDNAVNEVIGIYDCLPKAQQALVENIYVDLKSHPYNNVWGDCSGDILKYDIYKLSSMFYDDPSFRFDVTKVKLWNGDESYCEDFQTYTIKEYEVM